MRNHSPLTSAKGLFFWTAGFLILSAFFTNPHLLKARTIGDFIKPGVLIRDNQTFYLVTGQNQAVGFPKFSILRSYGYDPKEAISAHISDLGIAMNGIANYADGTLALDRGTIYQLVGNQKHGFPSYTIFKSLGFSLSAVINANLSNYEAGSLISLDSAHFSGTNLKDGQTLYYVSQGVLYGYSTFAQFTSWRVKPATIVRAVPADLTLPQKIAGFRNGTLLLSNGIYYLYSQSKIYPFDSLDQLKTFGFNPSFIISVSSAELPQADAIPMTSCVNRPACLDASPACLIAEPAGGWCTWAADSTNTTPTPTPTLTPTPTPSPTPTFGGSVMNLKQGDNLQAAVNAATGGAKIVLPDGYTWTGNLILPNRPDNDWVTITSNISVPAGLRVKPEEVKATLISPNEQAVIANDYQNPDHSKRAAHGWRIIGLDLKAAPVTSTINYNLVIFGFGPNPVLSDMPYNIDIDRSYIHGDNPKNYDSIRGIWGNAKNLTIENSYLSGFKSGFMEANTINTIDGPGPVLITNNYLEAAAENVMIGGSVPELGINPNNVTVSHNYFYKPLAWRGAGYYVKNLFEIKNGENVTIDSNVFENVWEANQNGTAILFTARTIAGGCPKCTNQNISFTNNIIRHASNGFVISAYDDLSGMPISQLNLSKNIVIRNNLLDDISGVKWGGRGQGFIISGPPAGFVFDKNTVNFAETLKTISNPSINAGYWLVGDTGSKPSDMVMTNNILGWNVGGDSRGGPYALPVGGVFTGNIVQNVFISQAGTGGSVDWAKMSPETQINVASPTGGADTATLLRNEPQIKSGNR